MESLLNVAQLDANFSHIWGALTFFIWKTSLCIEGYIYKIGEYLASKSTFLPFEKLRPDYKAIKNILAIMNLAVYGLGEQKSSRVKYFFHPILFSEVTSNL